MKSNGPFYLAVIERPEYQVWYKRQRMVINSINSLTKTMAVQAEIKGKRPTNHSTRKTLLNKLKAANQPRSAIIGLRDWPYKRAHFSRLRGRRWEWTTADFLNHKLRQSGKHVQPMPSPSNECWPFLCCGKHADDELRAVYDNQQFPRLSIDHHLPA